MSRRLTDQIAAWIEESLNSHLLGDSATFETSVAMDQSGPVLVIMLWMPSIVIGQHLQVVIVAPNPGGVSPADVDKAVAEGLESLREERAKEAAGPPLAPSGLLVPGR